MILDVALAAAAPSDLTDPKESERSRARRAAAIATRLMTTSRLVFDSAESRARVLANLGTFPGATAGIWLELLHENGVFWSVDPAGDLDDDLDAATLSAWQGHADLVVLPKFQRELLEEAADFPEVPEVCDLADIAHSRAVEDLERSWRAPVLALSRREDLWKTRFRPLVEKSKRIHVIDHFAAEQVVKQIVLNRTDAAAGVEWFFRKVALTEVRSVRLVTRHPDDLMRKEHRTFNDRVLDVGEVRDAFRELAQRTGLDARLKVYVVNTAQSRDFAHERHVIFDRRLAFAPHNGLASFAEGRFSQPFSCTASAESVPAMLALFDQLVAGAP